MEITVEYWNPKNRFVKNADGRDFYDSSSEHDHDKVLTGDTMDKIYRQFDKLNNSLRYCNGSYYKFKTKEEQLNYTNWYKGLTESDRFNMYYGNGVVD